MNTVKGITMRLVTSRTTFSVAAFVALVLLPAGPADAQKSAALVEVDKVIVEPLSQTMPVLGRFVARQSGPVAALVSGPVEDILVDVGDRVRKGDILVRLATDVTIGNRNLRAAELREKEAALETARADTELASLELRRLENLRKSPAFSQARYEDKRAEVVRFKSKVAEAEAGVARARANLGLANLDLGRAEIMAPYNGVVVMRYAVAGAFIDTGAPVVSLVNDEDMEIEADVPSNRLAGLAPGRGVRVTLDDGRSIMATVRSVVPTENPLTRTRPVRFTAKISGAENFNLATDQSVTVLLPVGEQRDVVSVHKDAVIARGAGYIVYVVEGDKANVRSVRTGEAVGVRLEVLSGLEPDELVVVRGNERLQSGQTVEYKGSPRPGGDG